MVCMPWVFLGSKAHAANKASWPAFIARRRKRHLGEAYTHAWRELAVFFFRTNPNLEK
jgi:hypothetical protein